MRICIVKATGRMIESQSGGDGDHIENAEERETYRAASLDVLRRNAAAAGCPDVEVRFVSDEEHAALMTAQAESDLTYADRRRMEYPALEDQFDALWKGGADADAMRARVEAVKKKYPKP